jgi:uncharacterized protein
MNPIDIIDLYYQNSPKARDVLIAHSEKVAQKALTVACRVKPLDPDPVFIEQAAMLHDIGIYQTLAPNLGCRGEHPYVCHGILGRNLLERHDLHRHALVCERHVGTGISVSDIHHQNLPLPLRDMQPVSIEEQIICYADKFFSKNGNGKEKTPDQIIEQLTRYGEDKVRRFKQWVDLFEG